MGNAKLLRSVLVLCLMMAGMMVGMSTAKASPQVQDTLEQQQFGEGIFGIMEGVYDVEYILNGQNALGNDEEKKGDGKKGDGSKGNGAKSGANGNGSQVGFVLYNPLDGADFGNNNNELNNTDLNKPALGITVDEALYAPLGNGCLFLLAAGACYALRKRRKE